MIWIQIQTHLICRPLVFGSRVKRYLQEVCNHLSIHLKFSSNCNLKSKRMSVNRDLQKKLTQIMGSYLLKGYTLLDSHCQTCQTPLMKTRVSDLYCIYCQELNVKDEKSESIVSNKSSTDCKLNEDIDKQSESRSRNAEPLPINGSDNKSGKEAIKKTMAIVERKIEWAADRLKTCDQIGDCLQLVNLMKASVDLLLNLNKLPNTKY